MKSELTSVIRNVEATKCKVRPMMSFVKHMFLDSLEDRLVYAGCLATKALLASDSITTIQASALSLPT